MNWDRSVKDRYEKEGWKALCVADEAFKQQLRRFCAEKGIIITDDHPEGQDWMILLKDGTELYVERRSYDTANPETDFWIDYKQEQGGIVAEFTGRVDKKNKYFILVHNEEIVAVCDNW
jgi:hypothetical protein